MVTIPTKLVGGLLITVVSGMTGLWLLKGAAGTGRSAVVKSRTEPVAVGTISQGFVELIGQVEPADERLRSPLGRECVAYSIAKQHADDPGDADTESRAVPFYVADDTGRVLVDVTVRDGDLAPKAGRTVLQSISGASEDEVDGILRGEYADATAEDAEGWPSDTDLGTAALGLDVPVREGRLEPGEEVYVAGTAVDERLQDERPVVVNRADNPSTVTPTTDGGHTQRDDVIAELVLAALATIGGLAFPGAAVYVLLQVI